ncbi:MAG: maltose alpha-D-glucosyltransferase [Candidatus Omnitrophota bacterium]|nr:maltose alpha-D-glucosyltransferase [Candidatus Omnitrophota bacterium]
MSSHSAAQGTARKRTKTRTTGVVDDPLWYKDAIIYELHVKAFFDSNHDGIGDFTGLIRKLDYLQDLGINCIWLLPFYESPLKDDGYDIADYRKILREYGTLKEFKRFVRESHNRDIRVLIELVVNHTSDQHAWFQEARSSKKSPKRDYYVWSTDPKKYKEARIIFTDSEKSNWSYDPVTEEYYWHRFFSHQPDLNFSNPVVCRALLDTLSFWLNTGVDGFRLDAVPYLFEREGTNCENLLETHQYLKSLRQRLDKRYKEKILLAEANQWPADVRPYFGDGDECHMAFHFPLMPRIFMAIRKEDHTPIIDIMRQTPDLPENCQWALFLRNHDELTLEMVTAEERDYMYKEYAADPKAKLNLGIRRRLAPLMSNGRRQMELLNSLLFSLPGTPVIYYGDELGMGDNIYLGDRNGVRTPMQWTGDRNAGFSAADTAKLYAPLIVDPVFGFQAVNVEAQQRIPTSFLNWVKRLIKVRKGYKAFGRGSLELLEPKNKSVLAYIRQYEDETLLIVNNLSRYVQPVELDLSKYKGLVPVELQGGIVFPPIGELPYFLTLGPHGFYWLRLTPQPKVEATSEKAPSVPSPLDVSSE